MTACVDTPNLTSAPTVVGASATRVLRPKDGMVTVITEKLRNQHLDDCRTRPRRSTMPILSPDPSGWNATAFGTRQSPVKFTEPEKTWTNFLESNRKTFSESSCKGNTPCKEQPKGFRHKVASTPRSIHTATQINIGDTPPHPLPHPPCSHQQYLQSSVKADVGPSTPPIPPKKRHCRSLSIPGDGKCTKKWQPQASHVWRPVPTRHNLNNNKLLKNRNSPLASHKPISSRSSPLGYPTQNFLPSASGNGGMSGIWPVSRSEEFYTPPESPSPVPRPASASSGYYDSSLSSLNSSPWPETSPFKSNKYDMMNLRSFSMEEPISYGNVSASSKAAGSMPVIPGSVSSTPSSPRRQRVPRCRSQPCVLHERKCGLKRRRETEDRPTLDFFKMKQTAYETRPRRTKSVQFSHQTVNSSKSLISLFEPPERFSGLNTIASSPLDGNNLSSLASIVVNTPTESPDKEDLSTPQFPTAALHGKSSAVGVTFNDKTDTLSDSGCSDTQDTSDLVTFADSEENSCSCDDPANEEQFDLEMNDDLDLEQIEKD